MWHAMPSKRDAKECVLPRRYQVLGSVTLVVSEVLTGREKVR